MIRRHGSPERFRGQAMVEFAFTAGLFFLLILGMIEGGRLVYSYATLNHAVQEGARKAALSTTQNQSEVNDAIQNAAAFSGISPAMITVSDGKTFEQRNLGDRIEVRATYEFQPATGMVFGVGSITLRGQSEITVE